MIELNLIKVTVIAIPRSGRSNLPGFLITLRGLLRYARNDGGCNWDLYKTRKPLDFSRGF
jgi:hypothetical protein